MVPDKNIRNSCFISKLFSTVICSTVQYTVMSQFKACSLQTNSDKQVGLGIKRVTWAYFKTRNISKPLWFRKIFSGKSSCSTANWIWLNTEPEIPALKHNFQLGLYSQALLSRVVQTHLLCWAGSEKNTTQMLSDTYTWETFRNNPTAVLTHIFPQLTLSWRSLKDISSLSLPMFHSWMSQMQTTVMR